MQRLSTKAFSVLEKKIFKCFYYIWVGRPSWSTDGEHFINLSFPQPKEALYEIWAKLAQWLQRRSCLKLITDERTDGRTTYKSDHYSSSWAYLRWAKNIRYISHTKDKTMADIIIPRFLQGSHLWFPIGTILAMFDLQVISMLPAKFRVNWPFSSEEEEKNWFSRWRPWRFQ